MEEARTRPCPKCQARLMVHLRMCPSCGFLLDGTESEMQFRSGVWLAVASPFIALGSCFVGTLTHPGPYSSIFTVATWLAIFGTLVGLILLIGTLGFRRDE